MSQVAEDNQTAAQRRREKILARATEEDKQTGEESDPDEPSAFDRYKNLKKRNQQQEKITRVSKIVGLPIVLLSFLFSPQAVFLAALMAILGLAFSISAIPTLKKKEQVLIPGRFGQILDKFHHFQRILFLLKLTANIFFSYLLSATVINGVTQSYYRLSDEL